MQKNGFTLAEVLITLGIIGVVAAMTLPSLIQKQTNMEVETKLKKIYSVMNQAILMSEQDNGPKEYWPSNCSADCPEYYNKYILPYLKKTTIDKFQSFGGENIVIYFADGSALVGKAAYDYFFFPKAKYFDKDTFIQVDEGGNPTGRRDAGIAYFAFQFSPAFNDVEHKFHYKKGFEPYKAVLGNITEEELTGSNQYACHKTGAYKAWCTALIQLNGWKIPDNYPFKVK